jgi:mono/diheme cytochrome c family protein
MIRKLLALSSAALAFGVVQWASAQTKPATTTPPARQQLAAAGPKGPAAVDPESATRGKTTFQANCAFCHGANAKGGESGPDLLRSELVLDDESGNKIGPVIHGSRADKGMPKFSLTDEQINDISAFLHGRIQAAAERDTYQILNIVSGDAKKGEAYFNSAGCTSCHSVTGDLAHIASRLDPVSLQQGVVMSRSGRGVPGWFPVKPSEQLHAQVTLPNGQHFEGAVTEYDDFVISVRDKDGETHTFTREGDVPKIELHDPMQAHLDMLPKWRDSDIHNLTAYLTTLK